MANDFGQEQQDALNPHGPKEARERERSADLALVKLREEIGELKDEQITYETAPYIAGQLLAREAERQYLEQFAIEPEDRPVSDLGLAHALQLGRESAAELNMKMKQVRDGDFEGLREFTVEQVEMCEDIFENDEDNKEYWRDCGKNLRIIAERIPKSGNGSSIKFPNPAWMEPPVPLRIQLQMMKTGGDIR